MMPWVNLEALGLSLSILILGGCIDLYNIDLHKMRMSPDKMNDLKTSPEIRALHYSPRPLGFYYPHPRNMPYPPCTKSCFRRVPGFHFSDFEDPISIVQGQFLTGVITALDLNHVRSVSEAQPRLEDRDPTLQQSFDTGMVFTFDSRNWDLDMQYRGKSWDDTFPADYKFRYMLNYTVRGALIRLEDSRILWSGLCDANLAFESDNGPTPRRLQLADQSSMEQRRNLLATKCSEELLNKFLGK